MRPGETHLHHHDSSESAQIVNLVEGDLQSWLDAVHEGRLGDAGHHWQGGSDDLGVFGLGFPSGSSLTSVSFDSFMFRFQLVVDLGNVDFDLRVPPSGPAAQPLL